MGRANVDGTDALAVVGLALLAAGVAMLSVPAAFIVVGALLLALAVVSAVNGKNSSGGEDVDGSIK